MASASPDIVDGHLRNGDFSRWIADVFRDNALASDIRQRESQYRIGQVPDANDALIRATQDRYNLMRNGNRNGVRDLVIEAR